MTTIVYPTIDAAIADITAGVLERLGLEETTRALNIAVEDAVDDILRFTNRSSYPMALRKEGEKYAIFLHSNSSTNAESGAGEITAPVSSISEGGRTVSFDNSSSDALTLSEYEEALKLRLGPYRLVYR